MLIDLLKKNIPFSPPDITDSEIKEVVDALKSGWITTGPKTKLFERKISEYVGTSKAVCLNSATSAMELTLRILGIGHGDEVITSAYTYTASASVISHVGAKIVLVDTSPDTYEMDYDKLEEAITERTKAIIAVDIAGIICDYDKLYSVVNNKKHLFSSNSDMQGLFNRIIVVSDAAHAFGAIQNGLHCGKIADFTCFSFHAVKNLTTSEGGAVVWRDVKGLDNQYLYNQYMLYSLHGQSKDAFAKTYAGGWEYDIIYPAYKCNMPDLLAAVGLSQLDRYDDMLVRRHEIIDMYDMAFLSIGIKVLPHKSDNFISSGHLYFLSIPDYDEKMRNQLIIKMAENGVACNVHYKPLPMLTAYKNMGFDISDYLNSYNMYKCVISLPLHNLMTNEDVEYVVEVMKKNLDDCGTRNQRVCSRTLTTA